MTKPFVIWLTGLSGSGKTTLAKKFIESLEPGSVIHIDGDDFRKFVSNDLRFSEEDRTENMRRLIGVCRILVAQGFNVITSFISPLQSHRAEARIGLEDVARFYEVYVAASLHTCQQRDPKGLYRKNIKNFTGIDSPYEPPAQPDLLLNTEENSVADCVAKLLEKIA